MNKIERATRILPLSFALKLWFSRRVKCKQRDTSKFSTAMIRMVFMFAVAIVHHGCHVCYAISDVHERKSYIDFLSGMVDDEMNKTMCLAANFTEQLYFTETLYTAKRETRKNM